MNRIFLFISISLSVFIFSCKEVGPGNINLTPATANLLDTSYNAAPEVPQLKKILIEELTGVQCSNCPSGHDVSNSIQAANPSRVIVTNIHAGTLTAPISGASTRTDFVSQDGTDLLNFLEGETGKPSAAISRQRLGGSGLVPYFILKPFWTSAVNSSLTQSTPVNIYATSSFNASTNSAIIKVKAAYTAAATASQFISVYITETGIIDAQDSSAAGAVVLINNYKHKNVFRKFLSPVTGAGINVPISAGTVIIKEFEFKNPPPLWNLDSCNVVALVHEGAPTKQALQATQIKLK